MQHCVVCTHHAALESIHLEGLDKLRDKQFERMYVRQLGVAKNSIFGEISKEICNISDNHSHVANRCFQQKKNMIVTKEKLGFWLETASVIFWTNYVFPGLRKLIFRL